MMMAVLMPVALLAGPAAKTDPVAEGFPDWQGISAKSFIMGREIVPSDLRHKVTIVVDIQPNDKLQSQLVLAAKFVEKTGLSRIGFGANWETLELPRDIIVVLSNRGGGKDKDREAINAALKYKGEDRNVSTALTSLRSMGCSVYDDVTFTGAPDSSGKRPFYGAVGEPKFFPALAKALEKGKPLAPVEKAILKDVVAKDPEKAKEAQILYDALNQTRSDLLMRISLEVKDCPHRAYYDVQEILKYWPAERKRLEPVYAKFKAVPGAEKLAKIFIKLKAWDDPEFTCKNAGEAKKIVAELNKLKKDLEKMKDPEKNPVVVIQNGASLLDMKVDELISAIPLKVPAK